MAEPEPGFRANQGTPEQLPQGEAQRLNEDTEVVPETPVELEAPVEETPTEQVPEEEAEIDLSFDELQPATFSDFRPGYQAMDEDEDYILGPTERPEEEQWVGATAISLPRNVRAVMPALQQAASAPNASPQLRGLVKLLLREADRI